MEQKYKLDHRIIAQRVREARKLAGMTQAELAEKIDISTNAVAKLENHLMTASLQTLVNLANVLCVDMDYFLAAAPSTPMSNTDSLLNNTLPLLSEEEKRFLIHTIQGLNLLHEE